MTPLLVINEKQPPSLTLNGLNIEPVTQCSFKHRQPFDSSVTHSNSSLSCKLPQMQVMLSESRFVSLSLVIDEDNSFAVRQKIEYVPKLKITQYQLEKD